MTTQPSRVIEVPITRRDAAGSRQQIDALAIEEPLEMRLGYERDGQRQQRSIAITMRTPGHDLELAAGFLVGEGLLQHRSQLAELKPCGPVLPGGWQNIVRLELAAGVAIDWARLERNFYTSSSCGICGKASLEAVRLEAPPLPREGLRLTPAVVMAAPERLREAQATFDRTGGLHGAALIDATGRLLVAREDVGRHNAVDKVVGARLLAGTLPAAEALLVVSGRASFELVQKALMAGIPAMAAVGAPSSLAVELAREAGMTLLGFVRDGRFNVYSGEWRLQEEP